MNSRLTTKDVRRVARRTIEILKRGNYKCAVFGSLACSVWGMDRRPGVSDCHLSKHVKSANLIQDVDIVVFSRHDCEVIKAYIAAHNDRFSLEDAETPGAEYKVLYFNLHWGWGLKCKVDILTPGQKPLHIPTIPPRHIVSPNGYGIPVVPLIALLILKVQGWRDHCKSRKQRFRKKIPQDIEDIRQLLDMADDAGDQLSDLDDWLPQWFLKRAESLVKRYTNNFDETTHSFRILGFDV
jgi:hypothetical protein